MLLQIAFCAKPPDVAELRERVEGYFKEGSFRYLFSTQIVSHNGRPVATSPALTGATKEEFEQILLSRMYQEAGIHHSLISHIVHIVLTALHQVNLDHNVRLRDWDFLVAHNPFISQDRIAIFAKGLHAGLTGDWIVSAHLLIPQLENSLRYVLEQRGIVPYTNDTETGVSKAWTLEAMLKRQELIDDLGEDVIFDLRCLLISGFGSNLRNNLAHGLMSTGHFFDHSIVYLWWLTLYLCFHGIPLSNALEEVPSSE